MSHSRHLQEVLLPDWARRDKQGTKGDRVNRFEGETLMLLEVCVFV
jgi:hypothetical protein